MKKLILCFSASTLLLASTALAQATLGSFQGKLGEIKVKTESSKPHQRKAYEFKFATGKNIKVLPMKDFVKDFEAKMSSKDTSITQIGTTGGWQPEKSSFDKELELLVIEKIASLPASECNLEGVALALEGLQYLVENQGLLLDFNAMPNEAKDCFK